MFKDQKELPNFSIEDSLGHYNIMGVDEAGRGPLAGPVVAAAVILPKGDIIAGINDSKKLSQTKRENLFKEIQEKAIYSIKLVTVEEIDRYNILEATKMAMSRAIKEIYSKADYVIIDGNVNPMPSTYKNIKTIIRGDGQSISIAAASILAKVYRDQLMFELDSKYPQYYWKKNKGYGSLQHRKALIEHGATQHHRKLFIRKVMKNLHN